MEKKASQKIRLGLFVIIGSAIFVLAIYFIGSKQNMFTKTLRLITVFSNINGLQLGNNVRYSGINVGIVTAIEMVNDTTIRVDMVIDKGISHHIKKDAIASIGSDGLVGNMIINIIPGKDAGLPVEPGDEIRSHTRIRTYDMLNTLNRTNENAALLIADLLKITKEINQGKGMVGLFIKDSIMANDLKHSVNYLKSTIQGTARTASNLNQLAYSLNRKDNVLGVIKDTAVANKMKSIVNNLNNSSSAIDSVFTNLNAVIVNIKQGKGVINYLSNDPELVKKIDSTMVNINEASLRLNQNLEALKHIFLLRGYFKKQEKKKMREQKK